MTVENRGDSGEVMGLSIRLDRVTEEGPEFVGRVWCDRSLTLSQTHQVLTVAADIIHSVLEEAQQMGEFQQNFTVTTTEQTVDTRTLFSKLPLE